VACVHAFFKSHALGQVTAQVAEEIGGVAAEKVSGNTSGNAAPQAPRTAVY